MIKNGIVKWFDVDKGEGLILDINDNMEYYFHYSAIKSNEEFKRLKKDDCVKFSIYENLYMKQVDSIELFKAE